MMLTGMRRAVQTVRDFVLIVKAEFVRDLIYMRRYPLETLSFLFFMFMILVAINFGFGMLVKNAKANPLNVEKMVIGYCLMQFVLATQMGWSGQIQNESQTGTLEQLSISGHTLGGVLLSRGIAQFMRQCISFFLLLGAFMLFWPHARITLSGAPGAVGILFLTALGTYGVAYLFAGITLLFKRVGFFFQIVNFGFLGLFWLDRGALPSGGWLARLYDIFPLTVGMSNLKAQLSPGGPAPVVGLWELAFISTISLLLGYCAFYLMEQRARRMALLSQY